MKHYLLAGALLATLVLAACGGGGGSASPGGVIPLPGSTPTNFSARLVFLGSLAGIQTQSDIHRTTSIEPRSTGSTPPPIMVVSPMSTQGNIGYSFNASGYGGTVQAQVSPMPTSSPSVAFSTTNQDAVFQAPAPGVTPAPLPSGVIAQQVIGSNMSAVNAQSSGIAEASIGAPVNQTPTIPVYTYRALSLECPDGANTLAPGGAPAWAWSGTGWTNPTSPTGADVYMDSPTCSIAGFQNGSESDITLHFPYGAIFFSTNTPFSSLLASQWQASVTSIGMTQLMTLNTDGSLNGEVIFKTVSGTIVKLFPNAVGRGGNPEYSGAAEVSGASIDGF